jgi:hypothetical protein
MRTLLPFGLLSVLCACGSFDVRAYAGYTATELDGKIGLSPSGNTLPPSQLRADVQRDLGLDDTSGSVLLRAEASFALPRVTASYFRHEQSGGGTLSSNFGDLVVGTQVRTDTDLSVTKLALTFDILNLPMFRLSPGIAVDMLDMTTTVRATNFNAFEQIDVFAPVPMPFLQSELLLGPIAATLDAGAIDIDIGDADGTYIDIDAMVRYRVAGNIEFFAGYRWISADADGDADGQNFDLDVELKGWLIGGGITF